MADYRTQKSEELLDYYSRSPQWKSGRGPSTMASQEEKDAWKAFQFRQGDLPVSELPESFGGRPTGSSRRAIRMQQAWDAERSAQLKEEQSAMQEYQNQMAEADKRQDQLMQIARFRNEQEEKIANKRIENQRMFEAGNIRSALNQLDPKDPDFQIKLATVLNKNPLGAQDSGVQRIASQYDAASKAYESTLRATESQSKEMGRIAEISERSGRPMSDFVKTVRGVDTVDYEALGRAEGQLKTKEEKQTIGGRSQQDIESIITSIEADMAEAEGLNDETKIEGLKRKLEYYRGLKPKGIDTATSSAYIPKEQREVGKVYTTPKGNFEWTGTGWKPAK